MNFFLVGLSGTGKSTFGKKLANRLNYDLIDLDELIEQVEKRTIDQIFKENGEHYFREVESKCLKTTFTRKKTIIVTGGGAACFFENMTEMKKNGVVVYLTLPIAVIASRLGQSYQRPLLNNKEQLLFDLEEQLQIRAPYYEQAHLTVDVKGWNAEKMNDLIAQLKQIDTP